MEVNNPLKTFLKKRNSVFLREQDDGWVEETLLDQHSDWVRDVAWAPTFSFHKDKIASCSQVTFIKLKKIFDF
jgi:hypothetical protein